MTDLMPGEGFSWWSLAILSGLFLLLTVAELRRQPGGLKSLRVLALGILFTALAGLLWKPALQRKAATGTVVLLGEDASVPVADSLLASGFADGIVRYDTLFGSIRAQRVIMTGQGIPEEDFWKIKSAALSLQLDSTPQGIVEYVLPGPAVRGDTLTISGYYSTSDSLWLKLTWNDQVVDSVRLNASGWFQLQHIPPVAGPQLYHIRGEHRDTVQTYRVPVDVKEARPVRTALFLSFPTFEARSLKEYLAEAGFEVLVRQTISRNRYIYEYLNSDRENINFSADFLNTLNLLIADQGFLESLNNTSLRLLEDRVRNGLGLIILADGNQAGRGAFQFPVTLNNAGEAVLDADDRTTILRRSPEGIQAGARRIGRGKAAVSLRPQTYTWLLEGEQEAYASYWSGLTREVIGKPDQSIELIQWPLRQDVESTIRLYSNNVPRVFWNNLELPPAQDFYLPFRWEVTIWPADTGWYTLRMAADTAHVFVHGPDEWKSLRQHSQKRALQRLAGKETPPDSATATFPDPLSPWIFYSLILLSLAFLWIEPKFSN